MRKLWLFGNTLRAGSKYESREDGKKSEFHGYAETRTTRLLASTASGDQDALPMICTRNTLADTMIVACMDHSSDHSVIPD